MITPQTRSIRNQYWEKRKDVRWRMKVVRVKLRFLGWTGRMFHRDGPACAKARAPHDDNVTHGTSSCPRFAERRFWRPGSHAGWHIVDIAIVYTLSSAGDFLQFCELYCNDTSLYRLFAHGRYFTIRYDSVYLTCSKKLTGSQLSLPHGA